MNVLITLTTAGIDTGPFNLYSNTDSYVTAFQTNIAKSLLVAGYTSTVVPAGTTYVRVKSTGLCTNYIDIYVTGSGTTTTTTTATPTTTTTTTQVVTYYNVVLCGTSTTTVIRHNGPNNVTLGVVVQSTNGSCYTVSSVGTGPETVGTLLTQFASCVLCQGAPPPTTTTTSTSTSTSTTTSTSTSTTTTTTTSILTSCEEWRNDTLEEATITYTPCNSVTPVSNYALATTSSVCAVFGSITVTVGGPLTLVGSCNTPGPTTTTTTTAGLYRVWNLYRSEGAEYPACSTTPATQVIAYSTNYAPGVVFKASNGLCYTIANDGYQVSAPNITLSEEFGTCTECAESSPTTTTTTAAPGPTMYEFKVSGGTQTAPDACLLGSPGTYTVYSTDPNPENNATLYTTNYQDPGTIFTASNLPTYWNGLEYPDNSGTFNGAFIVIRKADQTAYYYNCLDLAGVRYCSGYCGG